MKSFGSSVWERRGDSEISRNQFMLIYGFFTLLALALTAFASSLTTGWVEFANGEASYTGPNLWLLFIGVLVSSILGIFISLKSTIPVFSTIGLGLVSGPFGLILGPTVALYTPGSVLKVVLITAMVTGVFTLVGAVIPASLESWGGWLLGGLSILLLGQFGLPLMGYLIPSFPMTGALHWLDWVGVILFCGYVIFDVNRAMRVPATVDNAIDCALALYLDIINLFTRLLDLMGSKK